MKRLVFLLVLLALCLGLCSCFSPTPPPNNNNPVNVCPVIPQQSDESGMNICVDWMDFVRVNGIVYDGGFANNTVDLSAIGELIGEIGYQVKSSYSSDAEFKRANEADFASYLRAVGCKIYSVKNRTDAIAVLDGDSYYLYCTSLGHHVSFNARAFKDTLCFSTHFVDEPAVKLIDSMSELEALIDTEEIQGERADELLAKYTDAYFKNHSLILLETVVGNGGVEVGVPGVSFSDNTVRVCVTKFNSSGLVDLALHTWMLIVETEKVIADNVEMVEITFSANDIGDVSVIPYETYRRLLPDKLEIREYRGQAIISTSAAKELAYTLLQEEFDGSVSFNLSDIRFETQTNSWVVSMVSSKGDMVVDVILRASDGALIHMNASMS